MTRPPHVGHGAVLTGGLTLGGLLALRPGRPDRPRRREDEVPLAELEGAEQDADDECLGLAVLARLDDRAQRVGQDPRSHRLRAHRKGLDALAATTSPNPANAWTSPSAQRRSSHTGRNTCCSSSTSSAACSTFTRTSSMRSSRISPPSGSLQRLRRPLLARGRRDRYPSSGMGSVAAAGCVLLVRRSGMSLPTAIPPTAASAAPITSAWCRPAT